MERILDVLREVLPEGAPAWGELERVEPSDLPQPYRELLDHPRDMTRTLETFLGGELVLEPLSSCLRNDALYRQVVLRGADGVIEAGAIRIELGALAPRARALVLEGQRPLGGILHTCAIEHRGEPQAFFACRPGRDLARVLGVEGKVRLFGRSSKLFAVPSDALLAEAVEILPPLAADS